MGIVPHLLSAGYAVSFCKCQNIVNQISFLQKGRPMTHYNLYDSLALDINASSDDIVSILEKRMQEGNLENLGGLEEVKLAKEILGDPDKRAKYDARLQDLTAPHITVDTIRELAATANAQGSGAPRPAGLNSPISSEKLSAVKNSFNSAAAGASDRARGVQAEYKKSSRTAIAITAVGAFVAGGIIVGVVGAMLGSGSTSSGSADYRGADYEGAMKFANSFLELREEEETRDWIINNTNARDRSTILEALSVGEGSSYTGMDGHFGYNELTAGKPISFTEFNRTLQQSADAYIEEFGDQDEREEIDNVISELSVASIFGLENEELDPDKEYFLIPIIGDGEYGESGLAVIKDGKNWILSDFG